ncbi:Glycosyltransferase involved in cell wall biogenesis [Rubellimicrobium thermophilum DSM 16684]|uniref:Glycosyltransferase involved in cell wall biogenesis n=1 Tax=Rubellimicrobium thermophilum DSM 16684 TaxID=1123069 RepID=S9QRW0_9RHOB|nr:glycosyltransferase family 2 protein [Rubellimicrobium thermophilum]EPX82377.1 Glycosyltransferase involved in cell wall biogenesis [Rubellimicrobium thermophilum DSM 16684]
MTSSVTPCLSVIVPAANEARLLPGCLAALAASDPIPGGAEVVVVANGSTDGTAQAAEAMRGPLAAAGWDLTVLDLPQAGKTAALQAGDEAARGAMRAYLDADVTVSPRLMGGIVRVLDRAEAAYASGRPVIVGRGLAARLYARAWAQVPFFARMAQGAVPGCGLFAVNAAGRARWGAWPRLIADDAFVRLLFAPQERHLVPEPYDWPIAEGLGALIRVRRRQDRGVAELAERYPHLPAREDTPRPGPAALLRLMAADPLAFAVYAGVALAVRMRPHDGAWSRSR